VISRSGGAAAAGAEPVALDATDAAAPTAAAAGAAALYNCANPAYDRWDTDWPPLAAALLDAAESTGAVLATVGNLYGYGPVTAPITEATPLAAVGHKGKVRNRMWADALARHRAGRVRVTEVRGSDYVGPGVTDQGYLGSARFPRCSPAGPSGCSATPTPRTAGPPWTMSPWPWSPPHLIGTLGAGPGTSPLHLRPALATPSP